MVNGRYKILAIDGGGVRGIIPASILQYIEEKSGAAIHQLFDMIVGTSTGALIALGLTIPQKLYSGVLSPSSSKYNAKDLVNLYLTASSEIFPKSLLASLKSGYGLWSPKYDRIGLDSLLSAFFGNTFLHDALKPVIIPTYSLVNNAPNIFKSARSLHEEGIYLMSDIAGAAVSAPTYFAPKVFVDNLGKNHMEIDGGIYANNPEELAIAEALNSSPVLRRENIDVLSLGTGTPKLKAPSSFGLLGWASNGNLIDVMMNASSLMNDKESSMICHGVERLQLDIDGSSDALDNSSPQYLNELHTQVNLVIMSEKARLDAIVQSLLPS